MRLKCRTQLPVPQGLPEMDSDAFRQLTARIDDGFERPVVLHFGLRLHACELPWLAARLETILALREAALVELPDYPN